jgi:hypothetical protein
VESEDLYNSEYDNYDVIKKQNEVINNRMYKRSGTQKDKPRPHINNYKQRRVSSPKINSLIKNADNMQYRIKKIEQFSSLNGSSYDNNESSFSRKYRKSREK